MKSTDLIKKLKADGWFFVRQGKGSHVIYEHSNKQTLSGMPLSIPEHGSKDMQIGTWKNLLKEAGLK